MTKRDMMDKNDDLPTSDAPDNHTPSSIKSAPGATRDSVNHNWHNLDNRLSMIAESAYFNAEKRDFLPGNEVADWLEAEQELAKIMGEA